MKFSLKSISFDQVTNTCVILPVFEGKTLSSSGKKIDAQRGGEISALLKKGMISSKLGAALPLFGHDKQTDTVILVSAGNEKEIKSGSFQKIISSVTQAIISLNIEKVTMALSELTIQDQAHPTWSIKALVETIQHTLYRFDQFKSKKDPAPALKEVIIALPEGINKKSADLALKQGECIAESVSYTKNLANTPSNVCTPTYLANEAKALEKAHSSLSVKVLGEKEMKKLGMGAILGVSQGSAEEAKLISIEYQGGNKDAPIVFVGKGITFDTGGNSLKPADSMVGMKYDMCGAATVLGVLKCVASLGLKQNIIGIIPAVENMPGGSAYKPEDVLTSLSGQTIEVISTDAEGRLILADALTYAEQYKPAAVIDIATLTGAVVIALGSHATGLLTNHQALADDLLKAGQDSYDRAWQLPLFDEYQEQINSPFADMANTGGRSAGTITAGCFLSRFTKSYHWAHLDVAGTAAVMSGTSERKATGRPVPMLMQYLLNRENH